MQRFHRLGTISFTLVLLAFTFHILAISYDNWRKNTCKSCVKTDLFKEWTTSIQKRCYRASVTNIFSSSINDTNMIPDLFYTDVCMPNKYLYPRDPSYTNQCLEATKLDPHTVCSNNAYDNTMCRCDYTTNTKVTLALAVISSVALGLMIMVAHFTSYIEFDFILKWLVPAGFILLLIAFISMFTILIIKGVHKQQDVSELAGWTLLQASNLSISNLANADSIMEQLVVANYDISISWCFGLEIVAVFFTTTTGLVYGLMFLAKKRPESKN